MGTEFKFITYETSFETLIMREMLKAPWINYDEALARLEASVRWRNEDELRKHVSQCGVNVKDKIESGDMSFLLVNYGKYTAACVEHGVTPASEETVRSHGSSKRVVIVDP